MSKTEIIAKGSLPTVCDRLLLGDFDGLHLGHRALFDGVTDESIVFTFSENTKRTMGLIGATLYPEYVNRALMGELGVGRVYYEDFSAIRDYSPEQFVEYITSLFSPKPLSAVRTSHLGRTLSAIADCFRSCWRKRTSIVRCIRVSLLATRSLVAVCCAVPSARAI